MVGVFTERWGIVMSERKFRSIMIILLVAILLQMALMTATAMDLETAETDPGNNNVDISLTEITGTATDADGYTYEITIEAAPWILLSDSAHLEEAWTEHGGGNTVPDFDDWGLQEAGGSYWNNVSPFFSAFRMSDMYYCVGTITIKNTTTGWDITSNNPRSLYLQFGFGLDGDYPMVDSNNLEDYGRNSSICKLFFSNKVRTEGDVRVFLPV